MLPHRPKGCNSTKVAGKHEKHVETVGETLFVGPFNILQQSFVRGFSIVFSIGFNSIGYRPEHRHFAAGASRLTKFVRENRPGPTYFAVNPPFLEQIHIPNASKRWPYDGVNPHLPYWHRPIDVDFLDKLRTQKYRTKCNFSEVQWTSMKFKFNEVQWFSKQHVAKNHETSLSQQDLPTKRDTPSHSPQRHHWSCADPPGFGTRFPSPVVLRRPDPWTLGSHNSEIAGNKGKHPIQIVVWNDVCLDLNEPNGKLVSVIFLFSPQARKNWGHSIT